MDKRLPNFVAYILAIVAIFAGYGAVVALKTHTLASFAGTYFAVFVVCSAAATSLTEIGLGLAALSFVGAAIANAILLYLYVSSHGGGALGASVGILIAALS